MREKIIYYHFLNGRFDNSEQRYRNYRDLLKWNDVPKDTRQAVIGHMFEEEIPKLLPSWNLPYSFEFRPFPLMRSYLGPGIIRIGVSKLGYCSTYAFSFGRFFGGDLWISTNCWYRLLSSITGSTQEQTKPTPIQEQIRLLLSDLPQGRHPAKGGAAGRYYRFGRHHGQYYSKGDQETVFFPQRVIEKGIEANGKPYVVRAPGGKTYLIRSRTF